MAYQLFVIGKNLIRVDKLVKNVTKISDFLNNDLFCITFFKEENGVYCLTIE